MKWSLSWGIREDLQDIGKGHEAGVALGAGRCFPHPFSSPPPDSGEQFREHMAKELITMSLA